MSFKLFMNFSIMITETEKLSREKENTKCSQGFVQYTDNGISANPVNNLKKKKLNAQEATRRNWNKCSPVFRRAFMPRKSLRPRRALVLSGQRNFVEGIG